MAQLGSGADPLDVINSQRRGMRRMVIYLAITMIVPLTWHQFDSVGGRLRAALPIDARSAVDEWRAVVKTAELASPNAPPAAAATPAAGPGAAGTKISPRRVEEWLRQAPASNTPPADPRCVDDFNGWDYVCTYGPDPAQPWLRVKMGVRASPDGIVQATPAMFLWASLPRP